MASTAESSTLRSNARPYSAFALMCLAWGSTFVAIKEGVTNVPPFFYAGIRFVLAGILLFLWIGLTPRRFGIPAADLRRLTLPSLLMIALNYGLLTWGVHRLDSGLSAVVNLAGVALWMLVFSLLYRQEAFAWTKLAGIAIGVVGLLLLFGPGAVASPAEIAGVLAIVIGAAGYTWGTALGRATLARHSALDVSAFQMLLGGATLTAVALFIEPIDGTTLDALLQPATGGSLLYLIVVGSLLGFTLYQSLIKVWPSTRVSSYTFICPVIALIFGVVVFGKRIRLVEAAASALMLLGAYVIMRARMHSTTT
jgi:drug/metabolite transporter (DMT)-like permease